MKTIPFEGKHLRVWTREELQRVENVLSVAGGLTEALPALTAADGSPVLPFKSACHPQTSPELLVAAYHKHQNVLLLRCAVCRGPVMAFEVL